MSMRLALFLVFGACAQAREASFLKARTFKAMHRHPNIKEAKNVCLQIKDPCATKIKSAEDDEGDNFMAKHLGLHAMPQNYQGKLVTSGLLVTKAKHNTIDHKQTAFARTADEWSEAVMPVFQAVHDLKQEMEEAGTQDGLLSAVLIPQVPSASAFHVGESFDGDVLDSLLETSGSSDKAEKLFCEDIKKETAICFSRLIHYRHSEAKEPSEAAVKALRKHAMLHETTSQSRNAVLVIRKDHMGWMNYVEVEQKLRNLLNDRCWNLVQVEHTGAPVQQAMEDLKSADLVIANHGPHNENMIWMPRKAAFIEDKNCKCSAYGYESLAKQQGLLYANTYGPTPDEAQCIMQHKGWGICSKDKPRVVDFHAEIEPAVVEMIDQLEKDRSDIPQRCATTEETGELKSV